MKGSWKRLRWPVLPVRRCRCGRKRPLAGERGFALVVVLMVLMIVTFIAFQLITQVRTELQVARNSAERSAGTFLARAGIALGVFRLFDNAREPPDKSWERPILHGYPYKQVLPAGRVEYRVVSEQGKIHLPMISRASVNKCRILFDELLNYYKVEETQKEIILDSLTDWQDSDDLHQLNGAENDYYQSLDEPYIARNGPIQDPAEFFLIKGTEVLRDKFPAEAIFTVHNTSCQINFNSLTPEMLDFLTEGDELRKQAYYQAQEELEGGQVLSVSNAQQILGDERALFFTSRGLLSFGPIKGIPGLKYTVTATGEAGYRPGDEAPPPVSFFGTGEEENRRDMRRKRARLQLSVLFELRQQGKVHYLSWKESYL